MTRPCKRKLISEFDTKYRALTQPQNSVRQIHVLSCGNHLTHIPNSFLTAYAAALQHNFGICRQGTTGAYTINHQ